LPGFAVVIASYKPHGAAFTSAAMSSSPSDGRRSRVNSMSTSSSIASARGDTVNVSVYRGGKKIDIPVKLGERTGS